MYVACCYYKEDYSVTEMDFQVMNYKNIVMKDIVFNGVTSAYFECISHTILWAPLLCLPSLPCHSL